MADPVSGTISSIAALIGRRWRTAFSLPPLPAELKHEFTQSLGKYLMPFLLGGLVAAGLAIAISLHLGSLLALSFAAVALVGFGFSVSACFAALSPLNTDQLVKVESRYLLGTTMASGGLGGIVLAVIAVQPEFILQTLLVMVALAALGVGNGSGPGRPSAAFAQAASLCLPVAVATLIFWPQPWNYASFIGVLAYGAACVSLSLRSFAAQSDMLRAREQQRAERLRVNAALQHLNQSTVLLDEYLQVVLINQSARHMLGLADDMVVPGMSFPDLLVMAPNLERATSNRDEFLTHAKLLVVARQSFNGVLRLNDDRVIDLECNPVPDVGWVAVLRDSTGERNAIAELNREVRRCTLTGLPNRRALGEELDRRLRRDEEISLLLIDLDGFKQVNERHGHAVGDRMITRIGFRLRTADPGLFVARMGSDEFAVLTHEANAAAALALAQSLLETIDTPARFAEAEVSVGADIGIAFAPGDAMLSENLLHAADLALLAAKSEPGNQIRLFAPHMALEASRSAALESRVRTAIRTQMIEVAYQPIIDIASGKVIAVEALARMPASAEDPISSEQLVAVAEARGVIGQLRRQVMRQAALVIAQLPGALSLWVNTSVTDLKSPEMVDEMLADLGDAQLPCKRFAIEVTETALMTDEGACFANLRRLIQLGAGVAMDDFGAGFSSLDRLRRLPINAVKISGALMDGIDSDDVAARIFSLAAGLGQSMGVLLVAEGVEEPEQLALVRANGIQRAQGFLFSHPVAARHLPAAIIAAEAVANSLLQQA